MSPCLFLFFYLLSSFSILMATLSSSLSLLPPFLFLLGMLLVAFIREWSSVQITDEIATPVSNLIFFGVPLTPVLRVDVGWFHRLRRALPGSPDRLVRLGYLQETLVTLGDGGFDVGSYRRRLARCRCKRHRVFVGAEFADGGRRGLRRGHMDGQRPGLVHGVELMTEVCHQLGSEGDVDARSGG